MISQQLQVAMAQIKDAEAQNRSPEMRQLMGKLADSCAQNLRKGQIRILEDHPGASCPFAVFIDEAGQAQCAPIDPLAISFYEYVPTAEEDARRREMNPPLRDGLEIRGPLSLVDEVSDPTREISKAQLIAIQTLIGNDSTWWPVSDYSDAELLEVFGGLELNVVFFRNVPVGIAHFDYSDLEAGKTVKIVFIGIDPLIQGHGLGREILHSVMSDAIDRGATKIYLDTVIHRDIRSNTSSGAASPSSPSGTAHDVYIKSGFKIVDFKLIDPADKKQLQEEGLTINQLNGPLEYRSEDLQPLRAAIDANFGTLPSERAALSASI